MSSDAVGLERVSKVVGYKIVKADFRNSTPNLPQRILILGEANEANQADLDTDATLITSAKQAGELYGFGSPLYLAARILRPVTGGGVNGIPVYAMAQAKAAGAAAKVLQITPTGTATGTATHTLKIAGRGSLDGEYYDIQIEEGDTTADITQKIEDAVNAVTGCPMSAVSDDYTADLTSKWNGLTANDLSVTVDTNDNAVGITYAVVSSQSGTGTPSLTSAMAALGNEWTTIIVNTYGAVTAVINSLEDTNGIPDPNAPTGRYKGIVMKPYIALTGSTLEDPSSITDVSARKTECTIAICPAPLSAGLPLEAAANMATLFAVQAQNNPHLDVSGRSYPDMPTPEAIGSMSTYDNRDTIVKKGCSTVNLVAGKYVVQDFVTTYHPAGELPPQFRYCRNLMIDYNIYYGYYLLEQTNVVDKAIAADDQKIGVGGVIKPKQWLQIIDKYADDLANRSLIVDPAFMQDSIEVEISSTNPDRLETSFRYKRSGFARISSTTAEAGFNFGNV